MEKEMLIALGSCVVSFFVFIKLFSLFNNNFNIGIPEYIGFVIGLIIAFILYIKRDFFFGGSPFITGITIGILLSLLWNIRDTGFISSIIGAIISFRFIFWVLAIAGGIYKKSFVLNLWNKYIVTSMPSTIQYFFYLIFILFIFGSVLLLFPEFYVKNTKKNLRFTMNRNVSKSSRISSQFIGIVLVLLSSTLLSEVLAFIYLKLA